jgi:hypothetical protein
MCLRWLLGRVINKGLSQGAKGYAVVDALDCVKSRRIMGPQACGAVFDLLCCACAWEAVVYALRLDQQICSDSIEHQADLSRFGITPQMQPDKRLPNLPAGWY